MIIYIAGKMTGLEDFGRAHFMAAQRALEQVGHIVINPAVLPLGMPNENYLPITLAMLNVADAVFLLNGWVDSQGSKVEYEYAKYQHKKIMFESDREDCEELGIEVMRLNSTGRYCADCRHYEGDDERGSCRFTGCTCWPDLGACKYFKEREGTDEHTD